jgi:hypothetical protein
MTEWRSIIRITDYKKQKIRKTMFLDQWTLKGTVFKIDKKQNLTPMITNL